MPTIAAVVLTLNEESCLGRALSSLQWCDELLVLDSGSSDRTKEIAYQHSALFIENRPKGQFLITEQRNWALYNCNLKSDWVLFLDADEEISLELATIIKKNISSELNYDAYEMAPRYWFYGQWLKNTQNYPNWHPRLVKRNVVEFSGGVWESFSTKDNIGRILQPYEHYAFEKGLKDWLVKHIRYAEWEASDVVAYLKSPSLYSFKSSRKLKQRRISARLWPFRPILRFSQKYILSFGFLDGWQGLYYSALISLYEIFVVLFVFESLFIKNPIDIANSDK